MSSTLERVQEIARDVFGDQDLVLTETTTAADVPGWDSLAHVNLIYSIEQALEIRFSDDEFASLADVGALTRSIEEKLAAR